MLVPAAVAVPVLVEADVHAVSAAAMASAAAAPSAAVRGFLVRVRVSEVWHRCRPGGEWSYLAAAWRVQAWAPAWTASQGEPSGGV